MEINTGDEINEEEEQQTHMAMCAVKAMQIDDESGQRGAKAMTAAVTSGVKILEGGTPETYKEAMKGENAVRWKAAFDKEMNNCEKQGVWDLIDRRSLGNNINILPVKWVLKIKNSPPDFLRFSQVSNSSKFNSTLYEFNNVL